MKTKNVLILAVILLMTLSFSSYKSDVIKPLENECYQEGLVVYATFDGKEDYGYNFITKNRDGEENTLTFQSVDEKVLSEFDLNTDAFISIKFKITFNRDIKVSKDENNMDDEDEINTIIKLEKL